MFNNVMNTVSGTFTEGNAILAFVVAIMLGLLIAYVHTKTSKYTKNFIITLSALPILVCTIIMIVNGNLGTGVAILGAFSLIRFRSMPGNSKEIVSVFFAMTVGIIIGSGYLILAIIITILVSTLLYILSKTKFGEVNADEKIIKISIPENLDYTNIFDDIFDKYLDKYELIKVKTTNMGSIFDLSYYIRLKKDVSEKEMIDKIRVRNGNLNIMIERNNEMSEL